MCPNPFSVQGIVTRDNEVMKDTGHTAETSDSPRIINYPYI